MPVELTFDPSQLLAPISEETPCGVDPRSDMSGQSIFLQIKDARANARRKERALDIDSDAAPATDDWTEVANSGLEMLSSQAKDLEVCAWMIEALVRIDGFAGLYTGYLAAEGLINTFWDTIFPLPDEDGDEPRLGPFIALNGAGSDGTLIQPIRKVPLTAGGDPYSFWQYEQALEISQISDTSKREARLSSGGVSIEAFNGAVQQTPWKFYVDLVESIEASLEAVHAVSDAFSARVGVDAPPAGAIRSLLTSILEAVKFFAADKLEQAARAASSSASEGADESDAEHGEAAPEGNAAGAGSGSARKGMTRDEALRQLLEIAAFFRKNEPHSPISYTLEEIVRRGRMPLGELLEELIVDADARRYFYISAGLRAPAQPQEEES
ncbi:type VI secretion system protein TssA [Aquabacter sp. CN5-332]|uniref:type VI secretion system protein TssA n=1 Tax=Aquabacter sp. CN5-332 TaxID=3156608 RepID=UPI0032B3946E